MTDNYHEIRLPQDERRAKTWRALWRHWFSKRIRPDDTVLDLGSGYGDFINAVQARRRIAVDRWDGLRRHAAPGVEVHVAPIEALGELGLGQIDYAFASNLFEHLDKDQIKHALDELATMLSPRGTLTLLQPNYRFAYREYFDDFTHVSIFSDRSLPDFLASIGWETVEVRPRFLPLTIKSRLPVSDTLIAAYLKSPIKPMGKQMLIVCRPARG
jgi:SAM-dependent methyltransferase